MSSRIWQIVAIWSFAGMVMLMVWMAKNQKPVTVIIHDHPVGECSTGITGQAWVL